MVTQVDEAKVPCAICGKTIPQHNTGAGLAVCIGVAVPTYRPDLRSALTAAQAEIAALTHDLTQSMDICTHYVNQCATLEAEIAALRERVGVLEGALRPFADLADAAEQAAFDDPLMADGVHDADYTTTTIGLCREARAALSERQP